MCMCICLYVGQYNSVYKCWSELIRTTILKYACLNAIFDASPVVKTRDQSMIKGLSFDASSVPNALLEMATRAPVSSIQQEDSEHTSAEKTISEDSVV